MAKRTMICAEIDTGKRNLDVALDGSAERLQVNNIADGYRKLSNWLRKPTATKLMFFALVSQRQMVPPGARMLAACPRASFRRGSSTSSVEWGLP